MKITTTIFQSALIWITTSAVGALCCLITKVIGLPYFDTFVISLLFSLPALCLLPFALYWVQRTRSFKVQVWIVTAAFIVTCSIITLVAFSLGMRAGLHTLQLTKLLAPYVLVSPVALAVISGKHFHASQVI